MDLASSDARLNHEVRCPRQKLPINTEPTDAEYERYFELANGYGSDSELTTAEEQALDRLGSLVSPWLHRIDNHELAIDSHGLIAVPEIFEDGGIYTHWISDRFAVVPQHRTRRIDGDTRFVWAILPFDEQPADACSLFLDDGKFRRDRPELLNWRFDRWIYESIKARSAYKQHFGLEFPHFYGGGKDAIDKWIGQLNI